MTSDAALDERWAIVRGQPVCARDPCLGGGIVPTTAVSE